MTSHYLTIAGYLGFLAAGIALNLLAHRRRSKIPTMGAIFSRIMYSRTGRIAVIAWWAWLGMHLFSK
jgi:Family of unknown function (DUF6186)